MQMKLDANMKRKLTTLALVLLGWEYGIREIFNIEFLALRNINIYGGFTIINIVAILALIGAYWMYKREA